MIFDSASAKISRRRFNSSPFHIWADAHGNMQLCCFSKHMKGSVLVTKSHIDSFIALPCEGEKSVRFANPISRTDVVVGIDELSKLDPIGSTFGQPYYLVDVDTFTEFDESYLLCCAVE